jgi:hypothetical protein
VLRAIKNGRHLAIPTVQVPVSSLVDLRRRLP